MLSWPDVAVVSLAAGFLFADATNAWNEDRKSAAVYAATATLLMLICLKS